ncbi:MAG: hypothetical protein ACK5XQ_06890 [Flavobacteriales bacterium]|jgi:hypothetical protein
MKKSTSLLFFGTLALLALIAIGGCKKDKETIATVLVLNEEGDPVPGATVRLFSNPSVLPPPPNELRFDTTAVTNGTGKVTFNFSEFYKSGQAGFAVLDIEASKGILFGIGIIKIEEQTTTEESVTIQ